MTEIRKQIWKEVEKEFNNYHKDSIEIFLKERLKKIILGDKNEKEK